MVLETNSSIKREIGSLGDLVEHLENGEYDFVTSQLSTIQLYPSDFEAFTSWNSARYTRNCIVRTDDFELVLLCWESGQDTAIHGHDGKECWVKVLSGAFEERTYRMEGESFRSTGVRKLNPFEVTHANNADFLHSLSNASSGRAMSLHLYIEPIDECEVYNADLEGFETLSMAYDTIEGQPV